MAALSSLLEAEEGLLWRSTLRGLLTFATARRGSNGAGLLLPTDRMCLGCIACELSLDDGSIGYTWTAGIACISTGMVDSG